MQGQGVPLSTSDDALGLRSPPQTPLQEQQPKLFDIEFDGVEGLLGLTGNAVESTGTYLGGEAAMDVGGEASSGLEGMDWVASAPSTTESFDAPSFPVAGPSRPSTATTATSAAPPFYAATTLPDWLDPMLLGSPSPPFPPRADAQATEKPLALLHSHASQWSSSPLQGPPASTSSGKKPAAPSAPSKSAKVPSEPPKKRHYTPARPFTAEEETALLELAKKHGRKWATIGRDLALRGFPERPSPSLSAKHDALLMAEKAGAAGSGAAGAASEGWKSEDDAKLLHLAATFDQASTTGTATTIDWTTALPFFPGRTTAQLRRRLSNLKVKQKKAKQKEESERLTKAALEAFQAGTAGTSPSSSATQPPFSLPAVPIVIAGLPASTSLALPPPAPSTTSSSSAFPPPRLSFTFQGQPISSIAPTPGGRKSSFAAILNPSTREEEPLPPSSSIATSLAASAASFPRPVLAPSIYAPPATPTARAPPHPLLPATSPSASPLKVATRALPSLRPVVAEATPQALPLRSAVDAAASPAIVAAIPSASQLPPPSPAVAAVPAPPPSPPPHPWSTSLLPIRLTDPPRYPPQPHRPYPFKWPVGTMRSNFERIRREIDEKGWKEGEWPYDEE